MFSRRVALAAFACACALASVRVAHGDLGDPAARAGGPPGTRPDAARPRWDGNETRDAFPSASDRAFLRWFRSKGGAFTNAGVWTFIETEADDAVSSRAGPTGCRGCRGVFAKDAPVTNGDVAAVVPLDAALIVPSPRAGAVLNAVAREVHPEWALALALLRESNLGPASSFAPFLAAPGVFPEATASFAGEASSETASSGDRAVFFGSPLTRTAVAHLNGTFAGAYVDAWVSKDAVDLRAVRALTSEKFPALFPDAVYGEPQIAAALRAVRQRGVRFPMRLGRENAVVHVAALVPVAHALRHDPGAARPCVAVGAAASEASGGDDALLVRVAGAAPGEELRCHRGAAREADEKPRARGNARVAVATSPVTDAEAMFRFGRLGAGGNAMNAVTLISGKPKADADDADADDDAHATKPFTSVSQSRSYVSSRCGPPGSYRLSRDGPSEELRCLTRVAAADAREAEALAKALRRSAETPSAEAADVSRSALAVLREPVSDEAEARYLAALIETVAAILDGYPTSDAYDEAALRRAERRNLLAEEEDEAEADEYTDDDDANHAVLDASSLEAVRCRLREKRLLIDALNGLRRSVETGLPERLKFDVGSPASGGDGDAAAEANDVSSSSSFTTAEARGKDEL